METNEKFLTTPSSPAYTTPIHIRWMIRRDMPEVHAIDSGNNAWDAYKEEELLTFLRKRNCIGMVAEKGEVVLGFMIYELHKNFLSVISLQVDKNWYRQDIGTQLIDKLKSKLSSHRRTKIEILVSEKNVFSCLFLKKMGFKAIKIERNTEENDLGDNILFRYSLETPLKDTGEKGGSGF